MMRETMSHAGMQRKARIEGENRYIDRRREWEEIRVSREIGN